MEVNNIKCIISYSVFEIMANDLIQKLNIIYKDPQKSAEFIGLTYHMDDTLGFQRRKKGEYFQYIDLRDEVVKSEKVIERINKLRVPPALNNIWIAPSSTYHLQATGIDSKGRKQYFYHPKWVELRQLMKYYRLILVGESINSIRKQIDKLLKNKELTRETVLAAVVKIIDEKFIRVGNEVYAQENQSYGITTIRKKHTEIKKGKVVLDFVGKSGQDQHIEIQDKSIRRITKLMMDLPGYELYKYVNESGNVVDIKAEDVNQFIKELSGNEVTAKDFRTWGGTRICFDELVNLKPEQDSKKIKEIINCILENVAGELGNTNAVSKQYYIHPKLIETYSSEEVNVKLKDLIRQAKSKYTSLSKNEQLMIDFLKMFVHKEMQEILEAK